MNKFFLVIFLVVISLIIGQCYAQKLPNANEIFIMPVFIDSTEFTKEFFRSQEIIKVYNHLKRKNDFGFYSYTFNISRKGKVLPDNYEENQLLNKFFKKFNRFKWNAAYLKGCVNCKRIGYGIINLYVTPQNKSIRLMISIGDGKFKPNLNITNSYDKTLKMK